MTDPSSHELKLDRTMTVRFEVNVLQALTVIHHSQGLELARAQGVHDK